MSRVNMSLSRAAATSALRQIDYTNPISWEFSGFSQNGEDGIIDILTRKLKNPNRYCIEIGIGDGIENCTAWLLFARRYTGMMVDGSSKSIKRAKFLMDFHCQVDMVDMFVNRENINGIKKRAIYWNPDVFSIDVDGNDYHITEALFESGFRPKIVVAEYNSSFGPNKSVTTIYQKGVNDARENKQFPVIYFGVSFNGWKTFFGKRGYKFITTEANGVNMFFVDPNEFNEDFIQGLKEGRGFGENFSIVHSHKGISVEEHIKSMKGLPIFEIK